MGRTGVVAWRTADIPVRSDQPSKQSMTYAGGSRRTLLWTRKRPSQNPGPRTFPDRLKTLVEMIFNAFQRLPFKVQRAGHPVGTISTSSLIKSLTPDKRKLGTM
jgi:hypothetical protein